MERIVNSRLQWTLEKKGILAPYQAGFKKNRSTTDHLAVMENAIQEALMRRQHLVAVLFDIKGAYDMTWRHVIVKKLHEEGITGTLPLFIQSFLINRTFRVRIGDKLSCIRILENGVPQGSTISCSLFALAINDIARNIPNAVRTCLYVDDVAIFCSGTNMGEIKRKMQTAIDQIVRNGIDIGYSFSEEKTQCIHFCRLRRPHYDPIFYVKGNPIRCSGYVKFLSVMFDTRLSWSVLIENLKNKCINDLTILKVLANTNWGAEPKSLFKIYQTLVLSRIDYGCIVYSSARKSLISKLDKIHHSAIRISLGAFPTSPIDSLQCESGMPSLETRRNCILIKYFTNIKALPAHPNNSILETDQTMFRLRPTITRRAVVRFSEYIERNNIILPPLLEEQIQEHSPWKLSEPVIRSDLLLLERKETPLDTFQQKFTNICSEYGEYDIIFTDASKSGNGVGCAIASQITNKWTLNPQSTIGFAKRYAIWKALQHCSSLSETQRFIIASDNINALIDLTQIYSSNALTKLAQSQLLNLNNKNVSIIFIWVPGHAGIPGNELADRTAREASEHPQVDVDVMEKTDAFTYLKEKILDTWQHKWQAANTNLTTVKRQVRGMFYIKHMSRADMVKTHRRRIGHVKVTHEHLLKGLDAPLCEYCNERLTVTHIICDCAAHNHQKAEKKLMRNLPDNLKSDDRIRSELLSRTNRVMYKIETGTADPIKQRYLPLLPAMQAHANDALDRMLEAGIVRKSSSP
ncbi:uncharacterized protein LOC116167038 [Photinus pyralis]|uniref:uncharacterized protein LOC116167038 n=1 Tax=Photinus pyralis TaxID=7054 RepID=UPI001267190F|nr:uncharacterized protein LOC116167038 [Photinus pyralis]